MNYVKVVRSLLCMGIAVRNLSEEAIREVTLAS